MEKQRISEKTREFLFSLSGKSIPVLRREADQLVPRGSCVSQNVLFSVEKETHCPFSSFLERAAAEENFVVRHSFCEGTICEE
jgi:hypothetical protein